MTADPVRHADIADIVIVAGLSGAGRSTASWALDDLGWFVIDNLPTLLVPMAVEHLVGEQGTRRIGLIVDVRASAYFGRITSTVADLKASGHRVSLLFLDAPDEVLVRRFEYTRRPHPFQGEGTILAGIAQERASLAEVRTAADVVIDTGRLNPHELRHRISELFEQPGERLHLSLQSFGFKFGLPADADMVFDVRFLPNPHWVPDLAPLAGTDAPVAQYVLALPGAGEMLEHLTALLGLVLPGFVAEGKRYVSVAIGCTGGRHRSVAVVEALARHLADSGVDSRITHRDVGRE